MSKKNSRRKLTQEELERIAQHFRLLGEPMRLRILQALCQKPRSVNEVVTAVGATQANVSKHLSLLAGARILTREKDGQCVYYSLKDPLTLKMCELVHKLNRTPAIAHAVPLKISTGAASRLRTLHQGRKAHLL